MSNLRELVDGVCSLEINASALVPSNDIKVQDDVVLRRRINRTGPVTSEVLAAKVLVIHANGTAEIGIQKAGGITQRATVNIDDLSPVTEQFKRSSIQFNPGYRPRV